MVRNLESKQKKGKLKFRGKLRENSKENLVLPLETFETEFLELDGNEFDIYQSFPNVNKFNNS